VQDSQHIDLRRVEDEHWFYRGKREIARIWLDRLENQKLFNRDTAKMLDIGCGSGAMMLAAGKMASIAGLEVSPTALKNLRGDVRGKTIAASVLNAPYPDESFDVITCLDVIEHIENDGYALNEIFRILKPGGLVLINVPAYQWLWSDWDVSLGHYCRYTKHRLCTLLDQSNFRIVHSSYENFVGLIPAILVRMLRKIMGQHFLKVENKIPLPWINSLLRQCYVGPSKGLSKLFGSGLSVWTIAQKRQ